MADYIKRKATVELLRSLGNRDYRRKEGTIQDAIKMIQSPDYTPSADVAEVVHGKWFWADDGYCRCSECTQKAPLVQPLDDEPEAVMTKYCPHCGAKMDGREK